MKSSIDMEIQKQQNVFSQQKNILENNEANQ